MLLFWAHCIYCTYSHLCYIQLFTFYFYFLLFTFHFLLFTFTFFCVLCLLVGLTTHFLAYFSLLSECLSVCFFVFLFVCFLFCLFFGFTNRLLVSFNNKYKYITNQLKLGDQVSASKHAFQCCLFQVIFD